MTKNIEYNPDFSKAVSLLSIGGYYLEGFIENPKLYSYKIYSRLVSRHNGEVGTIFRRGLLVILDEKDEKPILAALSFLDRPKNRSPGKNNRRTYLRQVHLEKEDFDDSDDSDNSDELDLEQNE